MQGYIKLHRQITEWEWYDDANLIDGLKTCNTMKDLNAYYYKYEKEITDLKKFQAEYTIRAKELSKGE